MAKKWLKVRARLNSGMKTFDLEVVEQSHVGQKFSYRNGLNGGYGDQVFIYEDIALVSNYRAAYTDSIYTIDNWGLRGTVNQLVLLKGTSGEKRPIVRSIPVELWPKVKGAVRAYNEYFKD